MSMLLMVKAMQAKVGNPLRKLVLLKLADNANDFGEAFPSFQYIADQCEISRRSVINHIEALEKMGLLTVEQREGRHKRNSSNLYRINIEKLDRLSMKSSNGAKDSLGGAGDSPSNDAGDAPITSHSFEPVIEPDLSSKPDNAVAKQVIDYLNLKTGRKYQHTKTNIGLVNARIKEGITVEQLRQVIDQKCKEWSGSKFEQYLRPATLFGAEKCNQYVGQIGMSVNSSDNAFDDDWDQFKFRGQTV